MKAVLFALLLVWFSCPVNALPPGSNALPKDVVAALNAAPELTIFSLDPDAEVRPNDPATFQGWKALGRTTVRDSKSRQRVVKELEEAVRRSKGEGALCFIPHHGIRVQSGRVVHDLVICYTCGHLYIYSSGQPRREVTIRGPSDLLDSLLRAAESKGQSAKGLSQLRRQGQIRMRLKDVSALCTIALQAARPEAAALDLGCT
jgi:hypothetical protein